jgi:hypothetical protein
MNFIATAKRIQRQIPEEDALAVARMCTLLRGAVRDLSTLSDEGNFVEIWGEVKLRLLAAADQHVGVSDELEALIDSLEVNLSLVLN